MKQSAYYVNHPNVIPFPNAATREEKLQKLLDRLLIVAAGAGLSLVLTVLFLL